MNSRRLHRRLKILY